MIAMVLMWQFPEINYTLEICKRTEMEGHYLILQVIELL